MKSTTCHIIWKIAIYLNRLIKKLNEKFIQISNYLIECEHKSYLFNLCLKRIVYDNLKKDDVKNTEDISNARKNDLLLYFFHTKFRGICLSLAYFVECQIFMRMSHIVCN